MVAETVMFRHEKTFVNPPGLAAVVSTSEDDASVQGKMDRWPSTRGLEAARRNVCGERCIGRCGASPLSPRNSMETGAGLSSDNVDVLKAAATELKDKKPLIYAATAANADALGELGEGCVPLAVKGDETYSVAALTEKLTGMGLKDLVMSSTGSRELKKVFEEQILIRRAALKDKYRPLGLLTTMADEMADDLMKLLNPLVAATFIAKYGAGLSDFQGRQPVPCS